MPVIWHLAVQYKISKRSSNILGPAKNTDPIKAASNISVKVINYRDKIMASFHLELITLKTNGFFLVQ